MTHLIHGIRLCCAAWALGLAVAANAHEFWILPDAFTAPPGREIAFELRVGTGWPGESFARQPARIVRFELVDGTGARPIAGAAGADPAGTAKAGAPGVAIAVYRSNPASVTLEPELFARYLREEGLERIEAIRAERGQSALPAREIYSRCAKAIVSVGPSRAALRGFDRPLGLTLELIPERLPSRLRGGESLPVRLLFRGQPLPGALVRAMPASGAEPPVAARSDAEGRVVLPLKTPGAWLINAVHMVEAPPESGAEWESVWSSLTFEIALRGSRRPS